MEEIGCVGIVEPLVKQHPPSHLVERFAGLGLRGETKLLVRLRPLFEPPKALRAFVCARVSCERIEAGLRFGTVPMLPQCPAIRRYGGTSKCSAHHQHGQNGSGAPHLSNSPCTFASSTSASVSCFL